MRKILQALIRLRNPQFTLHPSLTGNVLLFFALQQAMALLRGGRVLLSGRKSRLMLRGKGVTFFNLPAIRWGRLLKLGDRVHISALGTEGVTLGNSVSIGAYSRLVVSTCLDHPGAGIRIGHHVGIGEYAYLGGAGGLEIGDHCIAGQYLSCHPENHVYEELQMPIRLQGVTRKGIRIGQNCWIGSKVTILDGVTIGEGCIIAAGAVVNRSFPPHSIIGGVPAKLLRSRPGAGAVSIPTSIPFAAA